MSEKYISDRGAKKVGSDADGLRQFIDEIESDPDNYRIDPLDFVGLKAYFGGQETVLFSREEVEADLARVEEKKQSILREKEKLSEEQLEKRITAEFVETMIPVAIKEMGWIGDRVRVIHPTLFDDFFRGVDMAVQINPEKEIRSEREMRCLGFSVDFTISRDEAKKKFFGELLAIARGELPEMKYFSTKFETSLGTREIKLKSFKIPKIILTCNGAPLDDAKEDFMAYEDDPDNSTVKERVNNNPLRYFFIKETLRQLEIFVKIADKLGNERVGDFYYKSLTAFRDMISDLGFTQAFLDEKTKLLPSLVEKDFDPDSNGGQILALIKQLSLSGVK